MKHQALKALLPLALAVSAAGQDIDLSGQVMDSQAAAVAGVGVRLLKAGLSTTTDSAGAYAIQRIAVVPRSRQVRPGDSPVRLVGGRLLVSVPGAGAATRVELFDVAGRVSATVVDAVLQGGTYEFPLEQAYGGAAGMRLLRVQVGAEVRVLTLNQTRDRAIGGPSLEPQGSAEGAALSKETGDAVDTLEFTKSGFETCRVLVQSYGQFLVTELRIDNGLSVAINDGDLFVVSDIARVTIRDRQRQLTSVRIVNTLPSGVPAFEVGLTAAVTDTLQRIPWSLAQGGGRKTVCVERTFSGGAVDTVRDDIDIRPWRIDVAIRNATSGPERSMCQTIAEYVFGRVGGSVPVYSVGRPWVDFAVDIQRDSSFSQSFDCFIVTPDNAAQALSHANTLRMGILACQLTGSAASHDTSRIYRYLFHPDSSQGVARLMALRRGSLEECLDPDLACVAVNPSGGVEALGLITALPSAYKLNVGRKDLVLVLRFRGRFFGENRVRIVSARLDEQSEYLVAYDAYPPAAKRDYWEYEFADDGATIDSAFSIDLNVSGTIYQTGDSMPILERGLVWDGAGADVAGIDLVLSKMSDAAALAWTDTSSMGVTMSQLFSSEHFIFPFAVGTPGRLVYPVRWTGIDPSQWTSGWYYVAIVTTDSFGNRGIAPFTKGQTSGTNTNPQHWQIVTPYHEF